MHSRTLAVFAIIVCAAFPGCGNETDKTDATDATDGDRAPPPSRFRFLNRTRKRVVVRRSTANSHSAVFTVKNRQMTDEQFGDEDREEVVSADVTIEPQQEEEVGLAPPTDRWRSDHDVPDNYKTGTMDIEVQVQDAGLKQLQLVAPEGADFQDDDETVFFIDFDEEEITGGGWRYTLTAHCPWVNDDGDTGTAEATPVTWTETP